MGPQNGDAGSPPARNSCPAGRRRRRRRGRRRRRARPVAAAGRCRRRQRGSWPARACGDLAGRRAAGRRSFAAFGLPRAARPDPHARTTSWAAATSARSSPRPARSPSTWSPRTSPAPTPAAGCRWHGGAGGGRHRDRAAAAPATVTQRRQGPASPCVAIAPGAAAAGPSVAGPRRSCSPRPRSFCAGVERAIDIVEIALQRFSAPGLRPPPDRAQRPRRARSRAARGGVRRRARRGARRHHRRVLRARRRARGAGRGRPARAQRHRRHLPARGEGACRGPALRRPRRHVLLIGHDGHDETEGTLGEVPGRIHLVENAGRRAARCVVDDPDAGVLPDADHAGRRRRRRDRRGAARGASR